MAWNHTTHYHEVLLRAVPRPCRRALEIGCGIGTFARDLAEHADSVEAIDRDEGVIARAREGAPANVQLAVADFMRFDGRGYDYVAALATLHHLPFADALARMKAALRPGGVLAILGLWRAATVVDHAASAVAFPVSWAYRLTRERAGVTAPLRDPDMTLREIRDGAAALLPGVVVRRHLLWRYSMMWTKPTCRGRSANP